MTGIVISLLGSVVLQAVPVVAFADPAYVLDLYNGKEISTAGVWIYCAAYLLVSSIPVWIGFRKFKKADIK